MWEIIDIHAILRGHWLKYLAMELGGMVSFKKSDMIKSDRF